MRSFLLVACLIFVFLKIEAQSLQDIDQAMLDADYAQVITLCDQLAVSSTSKDQQSLIALKKSEALWRQGNYEASESMLLKLNEAPGGPDNPALTYTQLGAVYMNVGRYDEAEEWLTKSIDVFRSTNALNTVAGAEALAFLGNLFFATGRSEQAEEQLLMALQIRQKLLPEFHEAIAATYNDLGLIYSQLDQEKSLDYYEKALPVYEKLHPGNHPKIALANINIGLAYRNMELYGDAVVNLEKAMSIWDKVYPNAHPSKAFTLFSLGQTYLRMRDDKSARAFYEKALAGYTASYGAKHPDIARVLNAIGNLDAAQGNYSDALMRYQKALQANVSSFNDDNVESNPAIDKYYDGHVLLYTLLFKAQSLDSLYLTKTLKLSDLRIALQCLQVSDTLIDKLRQQFSRESDKLSLGVTAYDVYAYGVQVAAYVAEVALHKRPYRELAFYFAEKSKSAVLLDAISESNAKSFAGIPEDLLNEERQLKSTLATYHQKLAAKPATDEETELRAKLFQANENYNAFVKRLEREFPAYYNLKFNNSTPTVSSLQQKLDKHTALVSYFADETTNSLFIFTITSGTFQLQTRKLPAQFDRLLVGYKNSMYFGDQGTFLETSAELGGLLIPTLPTSIHSIVVIPTPRLSTIPFETLLRSRAGGNSFRHMNYLIKKYDVRYEFSATLIALSRPNEAIQNPAVFLCAPINFPPATDLPSLPGTEAEISNISKVFSAKEFVVRTCTGSDADEKEIKSGALKNFSVLHFATHGVVNEDRPELSCIFLQAHTGEDGNLYTGEIFNLELNASLVTLSACQTGLGKVFKGEGVIGLSRALIYAGAHNLVVSLWSVADQSTAALMTDFYQRLINKEEKSPSKTLREAKLQMLGSDTYYEPFFWAPFVVIGY